MHFRNRKTGFTLVEILVVVVIISVLASISVVAYNGVQVRARNSSMTLGVRASINALTAYKNFTGSYPTIPGGNTKVCLQRDATLCWLSSVNPSTSFMDDLETNSGVKGIQVPLYGVTLKGAMFVSSTDNTKLDGVNTNFVAYVMAGSATCPIGPVATFQSGQLFSSAVPASGQSVAPNSYGEVQCWVALPN